MYKCLLRNIQYQRKQQDKYLIVHIMPYSGYKYNIKPGTSTKNNIKHNKMRSQ